MPKTFKNHWWIVTVTDTLLKIVGKYTARTIGHSETVAHAMGRFDFREQYPDSSRIDLKSEVKYLGTTEEEV